MQKIRKRSIKMRDKNDGIRTIKYIRGKFVGRRKWRIFIDAVKNYTQKDAMKAGIMRRYILGDK